MDQRFVVPTPTPPQTPDAGGNKKDKKAFEIALADLTSLTPLQKKIIEQRYLILLGEFERRAFFYALLFHTCRVLVTIGSLIVPALLSIQYTDTSSTSTSMTNPDDFAYQIYWATWVVSLLVTTSNGIFTLFKVDKKYYLLHSTLEQLRSEGWQYLELSGRFSGFYTPKEPATHLNQFLFFCHRIEKIKMHQVQEEYWKLEESSHQTKESSTTTVAAATATGREHSITNSVLGDDPVPAVANRQARLPTFLTDGLIPPTPLNPALQQLLQVLTVDGGQAQVQNQQQQKPANEAKPEVPVRSKVSTTSTAEAGLLRQAPGALPKTESAVRMGAEVPAPAVEPKSQASEDA
jgi:hypothetical protein